MKPGGSKMTSWPPEGFRAAYEALALSPELETARRGSLEVHCLVPDLLRGVPSSKAKLLRRCENVAGIAGRADVLSAFFFLLSCLCYTGVPDGDGSLLIIYSTRQLPQLLLQGSTVAGR